MIVVVITTMIVWLNSMRPRSGGASFIIRGVMNFVSFFSQSGVNSNPEDVNTTTFSSVTSGTINHSLGREIVYRAYDTDTGDEVAVTANDDGSTFTWSIIGPAINLTIAWI
jgi:hypothetical protein